MQLILSFAILALTIFALVTIIMSEDWQIRYLPKIAWILLVIFLPLIGSALWFILGRERAERSEPVSFGDPRRYESRSRAVESTLSDEELIEREIEFHEREARIRRLEADVKAKREHTTD